MFMLVIEHLEPCLNRWILKEYEMASLLYKGRLIFTNVKNEKQATILRSFGTVYKESATELFNHRNDVVILDPQADSPLTIDDLMRASYVIVGGIMGSHPPEGRTKKYISLQMPRALKRNIGPYQYTIAGAVYVLKLVEGGKRLDEIKYIVGLRMTRNLAGVELEIELPYSFPLDENGRVALPDDYMKIVAEYAPVYETRLLTGYKDVCEYE